jgi:uncharacterized protein Veg
MWDIYIMDYYSVIKKKNEIMSSVGKWIELKINMLRKISHTEKTNITFSL